MTRELETALVDRLHEASKRGVVRWRSDTEDANRELWRAEIDGEPLRVELLYVQRATGGSFERFAVEVLAFGHLFTAGIGSERYDRVLDMISFSMPGWRDAAAASEQRLQKAIGKVATILKVP